MVPRNEIVAMDINEPIENLRDKFIETGFSKGLFIVKILIKSLVLLIPMNSLKSQQI